MKTHTVIIIGAGPGGLAVAADLADRGIECVVFEKGDIGQSWLIYPSDTHLLSESTERKGHHDENMIAGVPTSAVFPHIPHPNHIMYQKYLEHVAQVKKLHVELGAEINSVIYNPQLKKFLITKHNDEEVLADYVVWAAGMYSTPNEDMQCEGAYIHYAQMPYLEEMSDPIITVVGGANGASSVVLELAKPGRVVNLVVSHTYEIPLPIDCLWKEQMSFIQELERQGLVKIIENFRVKRIYDEMNDKGKTHFILESETGKKMTVSSRPIICTGFKPNIEPIKEMIDIIPDDHDAFLDMDAHHQSKKQRGLYIAGAIGKFDAESGFIRFFRDFGSVIGGEIARQIQKQ
ncbi:NAD(P)-binding domain-containing protein [soil metagenome]